MKITNIENLFNYIKNTHSLKNKEIGDILGLSESIIHYYTKGKRNPENLEFVLKTFNFKDYPSVEAFSTILKENAKLTNGKNSIDDYNHLNFEKKIWVDLSEQRALREKFFGKEDVMIAREIYRVFKEGKANLLFSSFDDLVTELNSNKETNLIHPGRLRFMILNLLDKDEFFENVKNFGYSLSSSQFKNTDRFDVHSLDAIKDSLER